MMDEPNPPLWPDSVIVFHPTDYRDSVNAILRATEDSWSDEHGCYTSDHHFSKRRLALLFAPGVYRGIDFEVGYYVQVLGLGTHPDQVQFRDCRMGPHVPALNKHLSEHGTSLDTFWRCAENFSSHPTSGTMLWAVSQAAPLRRVHVGCDLSLNDKGAFASGGFMANCRIEGRVDFGGQQQWLSRSCHFGNKVVGGAWSLVFVGCVGDMSREDKGMDQSVSLSIESKPTIILEKPYITLKSDGIRFDLRVPTYQCNIQAGSCFDHGGEHIFDFSCVYVANAQDSKTTSRIQKALDDGNHVVLSPGIFPLQKTLHIRHDNQVLLGLGLATLLGPPDGSPCIAVLPKLSGVRIAGIMLEASKQINEAKMSSLLEWGSAQEEDEGNPNNPGGLFDLFCRVGGDTEIDRSKYSIECMVRIHSGNVVGDNIWLWRADHARLVEGEEPNFNPIPIYHQTEEDEYQVRNGIHVTGNDVTIYGLAVEHVNEDHTVWSGERGQVYFYQCELPYDVSQTSFGDKGYVGYRIDDDVVDHKVIAPGIYSNFRNNTVAVETAIKHPKRDSVQCVHPFTVHLNNNGCIMSIVNGAGKPAMLQGEPSRLERNPTT